VFTVDPCRGPSFSWLRLGVPICEDIWGPDVAECLAECGAEILISPNGSPFDWTKPDVRMNIAVARVTETGLPLLYLNQVGGQDELVFDGASFVLNADRSLAAQLPAWEEKVALTDWRKTESGWRCETSETAVIDHGDAAAYHACVLGVRDYVEKNAFPASSSAFGGIDSALWRRSRSMRWAPGACAP
jgi:NAD+ synthase